jgi:hypothetical protein
VPRARVAGGQENFERHVKVFELFYVVSGTVAHANPSRVNDDAGTEILKGSPFLRGEPCSRIGYADGGDFQAGNSGPEGFVTLKDGNVVITGKKFFDQARPDKSARPGNEKPHRLSVTRKLFIKAGRPDE